MIWRWNSIFVEEAQLDCAEIICVPGDDKLLSILFASSSRGVRTVGSAVLDGRGEANATKIPGVHGTHGSLN